MATTFDAQRGIIIYETVQEFYADRGGEHSPECDYGVWNKDDMLLFSAGPHRVRPQDIGGGLVTFSAASGNRLRVSVVQESGDVYAAEAHGKRVALLGNVGLSEPNWGEKSFSDRSEVYERADKVFEGWATDDDRSLGRPVSWFVERLAS